MIRLIQLLLRSERVRRWVIARSIKHPFKHLVGYMNRYWFFNEKWRIPWLPAIRVHCILRRDKDREIHDHPFDFRTFILFGSYVEQDVMGGQRTYRAGDTYKSRAERFHIIVHCEPDDRFYPALPIGVWTFVIMSPKRQDWGFLKWLADGTVRKIHHKDYPSNNFFEPVPAKVIPRCEPGRHTPVPDEEEDCLKCDTCGMRDYQGGWGFPGMNPGEIEAHALRREMHGG
jgi:hypothetical protein